MYRTILLAAAIQHWDRYSAHALAAREVAGAMAIGAAHNLHVLSVYDYNFKAPASGLPAEMVAKLREEDLRRTNNLMEQKVEDYIAPLKAVGLEVTTFLRVGDPRSVIVQTATELKADALIIGSHSKRNFLDIALGGAAKYISQHVPCTVILVSPTKQTDRKSTRLNSSHSQISYAVFCLKKKKKNTINSKLQIKNKLT